MPHPRQRQRAMSRDGTMVADEGYTSSEVSTAEMGDPGEWSHEQTP